VTNDPVFRTQHPLVGLCWPPQTAVAVGELGGNALAVDCTDPFAVVDALRSALGGGLATVVFVCANVPGCEAGAILACEDEGSVVFFSMATSFTSAALIAEGVGKFPRLLIGSGYLPGHAHLAFDLLRRNSRLRKRMMS
jgi:L-erythro-3,5-diaminohexanoate dehydrogenase